MDIKEISVVGLGIIMVSKIVWDWLKNKNKDYATIERVNSLERRQDTFEKDFKLHCTDANKHWEFIAGQFGAINGKLDSLIKNHNKK